jgi:hypothetical protein
LSIVSLKLAQGLIAPLAKLALGLIASLAELGQR